MKIKKKDLLAILLLTIVFSSSLSTVFNPWVGYIVLALLIAYYFLNYFFLWRKNKNERVLCSTIVKGNFLIKLLMHIYTILLVALGLTEKRFLSFNFQTYINAVSALCVFGIFKDKTFKDSMIALGITFLIAVVTMLPTGYIRVHDISFAAELVLIYYLAINERLNKKNIKWVLLIVAILFVASKDIQMLGFGFILLIHFLCRGLNKKNKKRLIIFISLLSIIGIYFYLYFIIEGNFFDFVSKYGIATSGRIYYYQVARELDSFNIGFLGYGRNSVSTMFANEYSFLKVGNMHSDILRVYTESGFIVFSLWLFNYFLFFPHLLRRKYGDGIAENYIFLTLFIFITYLTDNTELYITTQYFYMLMVILCINKLNYRKNAI